MQKTITLHKLIEALQEIADERDGDGNTIVELPVRGNPLGAGGLAMADGTTPTTLDEFFLADYQRLRRENEALWMEVSQSGRDGYGIEDLGHPTNAVLISVDCSLRYYDTEYDGISYEEVVAASEMDDDQLWDWAQVEKRKTGHHHVTFQPISVERHTFKYTLKVTEPSRTAVYFTDASDGYHGRGLHKLGTHTLVGRWQPEEMFDETRELALGILRGYISEAVEKLGE